jgi:predicted transcriptional regulator
MRRRANLAMMAGIHPERQSLSIQELANQAEVSPDFVKRLIELGAVEPRTAMRRMTRRMRVAFGCSMPGRKRVSRLRAS